MVISWVFSGSISRHIRLYSRHFNSLRLVNLPQVRRYPSDRLHAPHIKAGPFPPASDRSPMPISMYQASVPVFIRQLRNLSTILTKAVAHAEERAEAPS